MSQPVLPLVPAGARAVGASAGLVEGPEGGVVFVFGLATFVYAAGDETGRRLAAVQLVRSRTAAAGEVAAAFGVSGVTLWRWGQDFTRDGVGGLVRTRTGPRGPIKLTAEVAARWSHPSPWLSSPIFLTSSRAPRYCGRPRRSADSLR